MRKLKCTSDRWLDDISRYFKRLFTDQVLSLKSLSEDFQVPFDECHLDHAAKIDGGLFVSSEDAAAFLQPPDQPLDDVPLAILFLVKLHRASVAILVCLDRITGVTPIFRNISPIQSARDPLSPAIATGHATAAPSPVVIPSSMPLSKSTRLAFS